MIRIGLDGFVRQMLMGKVLLYSVGQTVLER
jgi:hypothetical protein